MFCEKCGTKLDDGSLFCDNCGAKVTAQTSQATAKATPPVQQDTPNMHQEFAQVQQSVQQQMATLQRPPMAKTTKAFLFQLLIFAALLVAFFMIANAKFSAKATADSYAKATAAGDWESVYSLLDLSSSELLSEEMFVSVQLSADYDEVEDFEIEKVEFNSTDNKVQFGCTFETKYDDITEVILVKKQSGKKWLFFEDWKIDADSMLAQSVQIKVPADATVKLNGVDLLSIKKLKTEQFDTTKVLSLPDAFRGTYMIEVSAPGRETVCEQIVLADYAYFSFTDMAPTSEAIDAIAIQSRDNLEVIFSALMSESSYEDLITANDALFSQTNNFSYCYENWLPYFNGDGYYMYNSITMTDIECTLSNYGYDSEKQAPFMRMNLESTMDISGYEPYYDWWTDTQTYEPYSDTDYFYASFTYVMEGEEWILTEINFY